MENLKIHMGVPTTPLSFFLFTALHAMQTRSSNEKAGPLSVKRVDCDKRKVRSVQIFIPYKRSFT